MSVVKGPLAKKHTEMVKVEWAPIQVPLKRRLQIMVTAFFTWSFFLLPLIALLIVAVLFFYGGLILRALILLYIAYTYFDHKRTFSAMDGNGWMINRSNPIYREYRNYFPVELVKTTDLPANRNYILASFPHGILGTGICINMGLDISKWLELFPKIRPKVGTLDQHFQTPILRELLRWWGLVSVSKESLIHFLTKSNDPKHKDNKDGFTSNAIAILVGGAQEALDSKPGRYVLTLKNRKGFVKMAIRTGSSIVPSLSFGEVDIFNQVPNPPDSLLRKLQDFVKKFTGISPLIPVGRGFFNYTFGFLPYRRRIVQVVGAPIDVIKSDQPDPTYVDQIHEKVMKELEQMFDKYKEKYVPDSKNIKLIIQ